MTIHSVMTRLVTMAAMLLLSWTASAAPSTVLFEGALRSAGGGPATDGDYDLTFSLYQETTSQTAAWTEKAKVAVKSGAFNHALGSVTPLDAKALAGSGAVKVLGVTVGSEPELPRVPLHAVAWSLQAGHAASADTISCTACVSMSALKFDDNLDLGNKGLKAGTITAGQLTAQAVTAQTVTAQAFVGDGSKLTGIKTPAGKCESGKVVSGINSDGTLACVSTAGALPKDGLDEISNKVLSTQFVENFSMPANEKGMKIPDNTGVEAISTVSVPSVGIAEEFFKITVDVQNTDLSTLALVLLPPNDKKTGYILCDPCGNKNEKVLKTSFPVPSKSVTGDLTSWLGKNPAGTWNLKVKDTSYCIYQLDKVNCDIDTTTDGKINDWSVSFQVLASSKVQVNGDLIVAGKVYSANNELRAGPSNATCDGSNAGLIRFQSGKFEGCDGKAWVTMGRQGAMYRYAVWSSHDQAHGWFAGDNAAMFGGVAPSTWGDGNGMAHQLSSTTEVLRTLFNRAGPSIETVQNAVVEAVEHRTYSSTNSRHAGAIFRVRNNTTNDIVWTAHWYRTAHSNWAERASLALNGQNIWDSGGNNYGATFGASNAITIPKSRTSTVVFIAASSPPSGEYHATFLAFYNNSLKLPDGLEFVDDLDSKPDGWDK